MSKPATTPFSTVIPSALHARLKKLAQRKGMKIKSMAADALREFADREEGGK